MTVMKVQNCVTYHKGAKKIYATCLFCADLAVLEQEVRAIKKDGLLWGKCEAAIIDPTTARAKW